MAVSNGASLRVGSREYIALNVFALPGGRFEGLVRIGNAADTAIRGYSHKFPIGNAATLENYVNTFKYLNVVLNSKVKCTVDLATPSGITARGNGSATNSRTASTNLANRAIQNVSFYISLCNLCGFKVSHA